MLEQCYSLNPDVDHAPLDFSQAPKKRKKSGLNKGKAASKGKKAASKKKKPASRSRSNKTKKKKAKRKSRSSAAQAPPKRSARNGGHASSKAGDLINI